MRKRDYKILWLFLVLFLTSTSVFSATRTSIYLNLVSRRSDMEKDVASLKIIQEEVKNLQASITANPFDEAARAAYSAKVSEGRGLSTILQSKVQGYNSYLTFIAPAFKTQGVGWANLFFKTVIPTFGISVVKPAGTINSEFTDASGTYPIPTFPSAPTISIVASPTTVAFGGTVNLQAITTGSGTLTITWATTAGTLSAANTMTTTLTAPTSQGTATIEIVVGAEVKNEKDAASTTVNISAVPSSSLSLQGFAFAAPVKISPTVKITSPSKSGVFVEWGGTCNLSALAGGVSDAVIHWTVQEGSINSTGTNVTFTAPAGTESEPPRQVDVMAITRSKAGDQGNCSRCHGDIIVSGSESSVAVYTFTVGTGTELILTSGEPISGLGDSGEINGDLSGD
ncbi:hypothetical protein ACFL35_07420 [Candidatus Riflebacteria bacterium]